MNGAGRLPRGCGKGAPEGAPSIMRTRPLGLAAGQAHRRRAGAVVSLDVSEADYSPLTPNSSKSASTNESAATPWARRCELGRSFT